jgi:hypothetical protein
MNIEQLLGPLTNLCVEDQSDNDFIKDEGTDGLAIYVSGHYSIMELEMKLRALKEAERIYRRGDDGDMADFCSKVIALKAQGYTVEDMGSEHGPQFDGCFRWLHKESMQFQDGDFSMSEMEAWAQCIRANQK